MITTTLKVAGNVAVTGRDVTEEERGLEETGATSRSQENLVLEDRVIEVTGMSQKHLLEATGTDHRAEVATLMMKRVTKIIIMRLKINKITLKLLRRIKIRLYQIKSKLAPDNQTSLPMYLLMVISMNQPSIPQIQ
jgi:hypothetical protein